ncbi:craniofacial development protein 2-like [Penaeus indicus]|uniref:craniofacial development protein 2-like n=1 Tax=Penaeus indicus TaxID=29960 RepID=UPI00300C0781
MDRYGLQILELCETNWYKQRSFKTATNHVVLFSGNEMGYNHGVAVILSKETKKALIGYSLINDRIMKVRIQAKPHNVSIIQCYAPTTVDSDEDMGNFYNTLQETIDITPNRDVKLVIGDFNVKVGKQDTPRSTCGKFRPGQQNERREDLIDFCGTNNLIDHILFSEKSRSSMKNVRTRPGADCNSDHQLLTTDVKFNLKKMDQPSHPVRLDSKTLNAEYEISIANNFGVLQLCDEEKSPDKLWKADKEKFIEQQCQKIEDNAVTNSTKELYQGVKI